MSVSAHLIFKFFGLFLSVFFFYRAIIVPVLLRRFEEDSKVIVFVQNPKFVILLKLLSPYLMFMVLLNWITSIPISVSYYYYGNLGDLLYFQTKRLFGHPNLIISPTNILGRDMHSFIARLLPEPLCSRPFSLHLVDQQVSKIKECSIL